MKRTMSATDARIHFGELMRQVVEQRQKAEAAWEQILAFSEERAELGAVAEGRSWTREELYEERLNRYDRRTD